jgi:hypothetical protein
MYMDLFASGVDEGTVRFEEAEFFVLVPIPYSEGNPGMEINNRNRVTFDPRDAPPRRGSLSAGRRPGIGAMLPSAAILRIVRLASAGSLKDEARMRMKVLPPVKRSTGSCRAENRSEVIRLITNLKAFRV